MTKHELYMKRAISLALRGRGYTRQNPLVGCVIVHQGKIIGEGWHKTFGGPHAEIEALQQVKDKEKLREATIYVTLEPCSHQGKTPSCALRLRNLGCQAVIIGTKDPNPKVSGQGIQMLQEAGIEVLVGSNTQECETLIQDFSYHIRHKIPWVHLKWAQSKDGFLSRKGQSTKITHPHTQLLTHKIRSYSDGIMIGANTFIIDNPSLDNRLYPGPSPRKFIILPTNERVDENSHVFASKGEVTLLLSPKSVNQHLASRYDSICIPPAESERTQWISVLREIYNRNVGRLMVEGGAALLQHFITHKLWQQATILTSPLLLQHGIKAPTLMGTLQQDYSFGNDYVQECIPRSS